jgi:D-serine deaminase-like pyridoxal phosphate-dependent protein
MNTLINEASIPSPALLILRERVEANLALMLKIAGGPGRLRPHVKTHKMGALIARQVELGIVNFKCSTIAEVEMCAANGASDVLLAMAPVPSSVARLAELQLRYPAVCFSVIVDAAEHLAFVAAASRSIGVFIDLDCGMGRTGILPGPAAVKLAKQTAAMGLTLRGLHAYDGHLHDPSLELRQQRCDEVMQPVLALRDELAAQQLPVAELITGGSPTFGIHAAHPDRTLSPGTPVLWDTGYGDKFPDLPFHHAAVLLTRVISKPGTDCLTLDLGHKAVAPESPHPRLRLLEEPDAEFVMQSEEHLVIRIPNRDRYSLGQALHAIPRHVCPTVSMYGEAHVVEGDQAVAVWPITARNRRIGV